MELSAMLSLLVASGLVLMSGIVCLKVYQEERDERIFLSIDEFSRF